MSTSEILHKPVLVSEVLTYLAPCDGLTYLDVTFGAGGHTKSILEAAPHCTVIAMDWDMVSLETHGAPLKELYGDRLRLVWGNFALLYRVLKREKIASIDGILADFGTSQMQLGERAGFSVYRDSPLDMRMSPSHQKITAAEVVAQATEQELATIFHLYGEERYSRRIARLIVEERRKKPITTTMQLAHIVSKGVVGDWGHIHPATRVFQALRIYVNHELDNISAFLAEAVRVLTPGARLVCISFHSLEDRLVKNFFAEKEREQTLRILTPKVVMAGPDELATNPSARSARLRASQRS